MTRSGSGTIPIEAEFAAMRLRGLAYLCTGLGRVPPSRRRPGSEGESLVMMTLEWTLQKTADTLTPPAPPTAEAPRELLDTDRQ